MNTGKQLSLAAFSMLAASAAAAQAPAAPEGEGRVAAGVKLEQAIASISISRVPTTDERRQKQRAAGQRVMLFEGMPGYVYRDILQGHLSSTPSMVARPILSIPQENPDVYGCVTVSYDVRPDGKTDGFEIVKSDPPGLFDRHALRAAYESEYEPAPGSPVVRVQRSIWFLVARPPRAEFSRLNDTVEAARNKEREARRVACEGPAA